MVTGSETGGRLLLAVDTTGERCSACIYDRSSATILARAEPEIGKGHAERLMGLLGDVLTEAGVAYGDLASIAVVVGPGSFTGIRVGVSTARGLALGLGIPTVGVDVLEALAHPHLGMGDAVLAVQDARRGEVYASLHAADGTVLGAPAALVPEALGGFVGAHDVGALSLVGSGASIAAGHLTGARVVSLGGEASIEAVAKIGARRSPGSPVRPLYLRQADAKPSSTPSLVRAS